MVYLEKFGRLHTATIGHDYRQLHWRQDSDLANAPLRIMMTERFLCMYHRRVRRTPSVHKHKMFRIF